MQGFFERVDAGWYNTELVIMLAGMIVLVFLGQYLIKRAAGRKYDRERARAYKVWEQYGPLHYKTQLAVMDALTAWAIWQRRSPETLDPENPGSKQEDWDAISLIRCLPEGAYPAS